MHSIDLTDELELLRKDEFQIKVKKLSNFYDMALRSIHCLDVFSLDQIQEKYNLDKSSFILIYVFCNLQKGEREFVSVVLQKNQTMYSVEDSWPLAKRFEKNIRKKYKIHFYKNEKIKYDFLETKELPQPVRSSNTEVRSLFDQDLACDDIELYFEDTGDHFNNLELSLKDEDPQREYLLDIDLELVHRYIGRFNFKDSLFYQMLWCESYEKLFSMKVDLFEKARRMVFYELAYASSSMTSLRDVLFSLKEKKLYFECVKIVENIKSIESDYLNFADVNDTVIPMSSLGLGASWKTKSSKMIRSVIKDIENVFQYISKSESLLLINISTQKESQVKLGLSGFPLRSNGISYDIRTNDSFYLYDELENSRALGVSGSLLDRVLLRLQDSLQSLSDTIRVLESFDNKEESYITNIKSKISKDDKLIYSYTETPSGELSFLFSVKKNEGVIHSFSLASASEVCCNYIEKLQEVYSFKDIQLHYLSLGICASEINI